MKTFFVGAASDLGLTTDGTSLAPNIILSDIDNNKKIIKSLDVIKSNDINDLRKNINEINEFNSRLFNAIKDINDFVITVGGDHSIAIASGFASLFKNKDIGLMWIDAHIDYNTFDTTITGNIHGMPFSTLNGLNKELRRFYDGISFNPKKSVVVGYRAQEENKEEELKVAREMGITIFTTEDIKKYGVKYVMDKAFEITGNVHVSFDLDVIDPFICPGVSVPEANGINYNETYEIIDYLYNNKSSIKSLDVVEYNPLYDKEEKSLLIAKDIINKMIKE